jgi:hypothetical protein
MTNDSLTWRRKAQRSLEKSRHVREKCDGGGQGEGEGIACPNGQQGLAT